MKTQPSTKVTETAYWIGFTAADVGKFWIQKDNKVATQIKFRYTSGRLEILSTFTFKSSYFPFLKKPDQYRLAKRREILEMEHALNVYIEQMFTNIS